MMEATIDTAPRANGYTTVLVPPLDTSRAPSTMVAISVTA